MVSTVRIDKYLWAVRLYKTRSLAAEACTKGKISINGINAKPSRDVKIGDVIHVVKNPVTYHYKVIDVTDKRLGAKLVSEFLLDTTPKENLEVLEMQKFMQWSNRDRGAGRPTKKERREIDRLLDDE
jgi:ribosome-associated heat shock protein Hsp15